jgi:hypothetical protein
MKRNVTTISRGSGVLAATRMEANMRVEKNLRVIRTIRGAILLIAAGTPLLQPTALAQCTFSSGSTGADGAFTPTNSMPATGWSISNNVVTVTNKPDGIFHFTSIYIETNWIVKFTKNALNTPVFLLAQSNVTIRGTIAFQGADGTSTSGGEGAPGGFDAGTAEATIGTHGFGPGGGGYGVGGNAGHLNAALCCWGSGYRAGAAYGVIDALPMIGGSGGGGKGGAGGGGGGGAILIASSGTITCQGTITASGGSAGAGKGSGGSIRLVANTIEGEGLISAVGGDGNTGLGIIRLEACINRRLSLSSPPGTFGPPGVAFLNPSPTIRVTSIAAQNPPWPPAGSLTVPDVYLPSNFTNPATISVAASNINLGTAFQVIVTPAYGTNIVATGTLSSGNYAFSTGSVSMNVYTDRVFRVNALIDYIPRP